MLIRLVYRFGEVVIMVIDFMDCDVLCYVVYIILEILEKVD